MPAFQDFLVIILQPTIFKEKKKRPQAFWIETNLSVVLEHPH